MPPRDELRPPEGDWLGTPFLEFQRHGPLAHCVVNRPEKRNALSGAMYFGIRYAVDLVNADDSLAGLLITGTGDVFIPGGDLSGAAGDEWTDLPRLLGMDNTPFERIRNSPKPVVCAINGIAQGGGLMIAMLSDVSVASERATFRAPELLRGIADTNYGQILPRQVGPARARDMMLTGRTVSAAEAVEWGLVSRMCPHDQLLDVAEDALAWCARTAPDARRQVKRVMDEFYGRYDRSTMDASLGSDEAMEGYHAFAERRSPDWVPEQLRIEGRL
jgi:enoyl-CoA hydratase/carnithine racemase